MTLATSKISVLLDEGTPVLAAEPFRLRGHGVIYHNEVCAASANDEIVVAMALLNQAILIAVDLDMKRFARRFGAPNGTQKYKDLHLISVSCPETIAAHRLEHAASFIEHEWAYACEKKSRRLWVDIGPHRLTSHR